MPIQAALGVALFTWAAGCLGQGAPTTPGFPDGKTRVLFIGNSLTYVNDLPRMVEAVARLGGDTSMATAAVAFPDFALEDHWNEGSARKALAQSRWEFVVMQQGPSSLPENQASLATWAGRFDPIIRGAGAEPVLYMVWPSAGRSGDFPGVLAGYRNAAAAVRGRFAPAGDAWLAAWALDPATALYGGDGFHPSASGTYLAALVIVGRITGLDPRTLPASIPFNGGTLSLPEAARPAAPTGRPDGADQKPRPADLLTARLTLFVVVFSSLAGPQQAGRPAHPAADSAAVARSAWREMVRAERAGDLAGAWTAVSRAAAAWPEQPTYLEGLAVIAARRNDTTALLGALDRLRRIEVAGFSVADTAVIRLGTVPAVGRALRSLAAAAAPTRRSTPWATLTDTTIYAEGIGADPASGSIYLGSVRHRTVYQITPGKPPRDLGLARWPRVGAVLGVRFDPARGVVWATTAGLPVMAGYQPADSAIAALLKIRPEDGTILARYDLPADLPHVAGDLAIGPGGDVYVTDSRSPVIYRLASDGDSLTAFRHPLFRSLQGVAPTPDGGFVFLADYSHGLLRWDLGTGAVVRLTAPPPATTLGVDGIVLDRNRIFGIQNGAVPARLVRFDLDRSGTRIRSVVVVDRHQPLADEPTIATVLGPNLVYVANSQWEKYDDQGGRKAGTTLAPTILLALKIR